MFTKEAQTLAKVTVEAIKKIAEKAERKCPQCGGYGGHYRVRKKKYSTEGCHEECPVCNGTGKIKGKWEWEPEVGEWGILRDKLVLITHFRKRKRQTIDYQTLTIKCGTSDLDLFVENAIPLLHWERIEEILEGMGYYLALNKPCNCSVCKKKGVYVDEWRASFVESDSGKCGTGWAKTRQEAVQRAVIELGKRKEEK